MFPVPTSSLFRSETPPNFALSPMSTTLVVTKLSFEQKSNLRLSNRIVLGLFTVVFSLPRDWVFLHDQNVKNREVVQWAREWRAYFLV